MESKLVRITVHAMGQTFLFTYVEYTELAVLQSKLTERSSSPLPSSPPATGNKKKQKKKATKAPNNPISTVELGVLKRAEDLKLKLGSLSGSYYPLDCPFPFLPHFQLSTEFDDNLIICSI